LAGAILAGAGDSDSRNPTRRGLGPSGASELGRLPHINDINDLQIRINLDLTFVVT